MRPGIPDPASEVSPCAQQQLQIYSKMLATIPQSPGNLVFKGNKSYVIDRD